MKNFRRILGEYKIKIVVGDVVDEGLGRFLCVEAGNRETKAEILQVDDNEVVIPITKQWYIVLRELEEGDKIKPLGKITQGFQTGSAEPQIGRLRVVDFLNNVDSIKAEVVEREKNEKQEVVKKHIKQEVNTNQLSLGL